MAGSWHRHLAGPPRDPAPSREPHREGRVDRNRTRRLGPARVVLPRRLHLGSPRPDRVQADPLVMFGPPATTAAPGPRRVASEGVTNRRGSRCGHGSSAHPRSPFDTRSKRHRSVRGLPKWAVGTPCTARRRSVVLKVVLRSPEPPPSNSLVSPATPRLLEAPRTLRSPGRGAKGPKVPLGRRSQRLRVEDPAASFRPLRHGNPAARPRGAEGPGCVGPKVTSIPKSTTAWGKTTTPKTVHPPI